MPPPIVPPAPVRLSITICVPRSSPIFVYTTRLTVSIEEPGDCATMTRTGRIGYFDASACAATTQCGRSAASAQPAASTMRGTYLIDVLLVMMPALVERLRLWATLILRRHTHNCRKLPAPRHTPAA